MRPRTTKVAILLASVCLLTSPAMADFVPFEFQYEGNTYEAVTRVLIQTSAGGEVPFIATIVENDIAGHAVGTSFDTFCLESYLYFYPGATYYASIDTVAAEGLTKPDGSYGSSDPLSDETAWVYRSYLDGSLAASAQEVQEAIYWLEDEVGSNNAVAQAAAAHAGEGLGDVRVLNLWTLTWNGSDYDVIDRQSQLVQTPLGPPIPAPGAAVLGAIGLGLVSWFRRRLV